MRENVGSLDRNFRLVAGPVPVALGVAVAARILDVGLSGTVSQVVGALGLDTCGNGR